MNFPLKFKFLEEPSSETAFTLGIMYASIKKHQNSFGKLDQFQFNENGRYANDQTKNYLTQLV